MSKKRRAKKAAQAVVVDEVLAEGSGPHAIPEEEGVVAVRVSSEPLEDGGDPAGDPTGESGSVDAVAEAVIAKHEARGGESKRKSRKGRKAAEVSDETETDADAEADTGAEIIAAADSDSDAEADAVFEAEADAVFAADADAEADAVFAADDGGAATAGSTELAVVDGDDDVDGEGAELPVSAATMSPAQLKSLVEALVFASDKPVTVPQLRQLTRVADVTRLEQALVELAADYENRGLILHQVSGGYQFRTRPQFSIWVQQLIAGRPVRLSRAQLETLAIVAYRQPITRPEIDDIRGVDSSATLKLLLDRTLIRPLGKKEEVGRPTLYGTTKEFLDFFSLGDLRELPTLREYSELTEESRKVMIERLGIDPDGGGEGGSTPPADSGPMDSGPVSGAEGASMASGTDGDDLGDATHTSRAETDVEDGSETFASGDAESLESETFRSTESIAASDDADGLGGETVQASESPDGEGLDDATIGTSGELDDMPVTDEREPTNPDAFEAAGDESSSDLRATTHDDAFDDEREAVGDATLDGMRASTDNDASIDVIEAFDEAVFAEELDAELALGSGPITSESGAAALAAELAAELRAEDEAAAAGVGSELDPVFASDEPATGDVDPETLE